MTLRPVAVCALLTACVGAHVGQAGEQKIVLRDHIGRKWSRELVTFPFSADTGQCHRDSVTVRGPNGPVACQLSHVRLWPGGKSMVKSARLCMVVDLAPLAADTYMVRYDPEPTDATGPTTDLTVQSGEGQVEVTTRLFGARLLVGRRTYARATDAEKVPGPVSAMRLADGTWFGASRLYGPAKVKSYQARVTATGPVFAEVVCRYTYADGNTLDLRAHVAAGDSAILWDARVKNAAADSGWHLALSRGLPPLTWRAVIESGSRLAPKLKRKVKINDWVNVPLASHPVGVVTNLSPWHDWWSEYTQTIVRLTMPGKRRELRITRRDAGVWVTPAPVGKLGGGQELNLKMVPLVRDASGDVHLRINNAQGQRRLAVGTHPVPAKEDPSFAYMGRYKVIRHGEIGRHLDDVKDYVLDWPVKTPHPHLYLNKRQLQRIWRRKPDPRKIEKMLTRSGRRVDWGSSYCETMGLGAYLLTGRKDVAKRALIVERLGHHLGLLGYLDTWRRDGMLCGLYDAVMGSGLVSPKQRKLFQAQLAYLGYRAADPATWSMERGYRSGNLNMSVANTMLQGILACTIPDHPQAKTWCQPALVMMEQMLATQVGPAGEWPESVAHYAHVSAAPLLLFSIAAKNAGLGDFINDPRMKRLQLFLAKQYTPPDPRHTENIKQGKAGLLPPVGRGPAGEAFGLHGAMARATADSDPDYSRVLQWVWMRTGQPRRITGDHMAGWEHVCMDPGLPAKAPDWPFDHFPRTGTIMRHGVGTPNEWYVYLICENDYTVPTESGTLPMIFAKGVPISARFLCSYPDREELLLTRVLLARGRGAPKERSARFGHHAKRKLTHVSALPRQQYVAGEFTIDKPWSKNMHPPQANSYSYMRILPEWPPVRREGKPGVTWRRQVLFVRDDSPAGTNYLVLRDTVTGGQPTMWQFWTLSEKIGTPQQVANRKRFLADAPGKKTVPPRALPPGDRYTAAGQYNVDVEFYIGEPADTPRHTLRFGLTHAYSTVGGYSEYQDLLHLQRPDDGTYHVVVYPRKRAEAVPTFATLGDGKVIRVTGKHGTDLCFLSSAQARVTADNASFRGTAATVQDRRSGLVLSLGAPGLVRYKDHGLLAKCAASVSVARQALTVSLAHDHPATVVKLLAPGDWKLADDQPHAKLVRDAKRGHTLHVPQGVRAVTLVQP